MKIRFQADADLNSDIVTGIRRRVPEIDFQTADEAGIRSLTDSEVLTIAAEQSRLLVTHDRRSMPIHFGRFIQQRHSSGLVIISQQMPVAQAIEELLLLWLASESHEHVDLIHTLPL